MQSELRRNARSSFTEKQASRKSKFRKSAHCLGALTRKRKPYLKPYSDQNYFRFDWLINTFLAYFEEWKKNIEARPGDYSKNAKGRMFISWQTYEGILITTYSVIEAVKFLINEGFEKVLTERFCQDPVEEYFGNQRKLGQLAQFGYYVYREMSHAHQVISVSICD